MDTVCICFVLILHVEPEWLDAFCWMHFANTFEAIIHGGEPLKSEQLVPWSGKYGPMGTSKNRDD